ncbi:MAG: hypothetical protein HY925_05765 [Elusimicrobia bacterium]|nr:hypothetical protein [Elusimicrobiota bacterium]
MVGRALSLLLFLGALVWADVARRAYVSCRAGERYLEWNRNPKLQREHWDAWLKKREAFFDAELARGAMTKDERMWRSRAAKAEYDERVSESNLKYAVRWFETTVDLFSMPPSPWSAEAKALLGPAREDWRRELASKGLSLDDFAAR